MFSNLINISTNYNSIYLMNKDRECNGMTLMLYWFKWGFIDNNQPNLNYWGTDLQLRQSLGWKQSVSIQLLKAESHCGWKTRKIFAKISMGCNRGHRYMSLDTSPTYVSMVTCGMKLKNMVRKIDSGLMCSWFKGGMKT